MYRILDHFLMIETDASASFLGFSILFPSPRFGSSLLSCASWNQICGYRNILHFSGFLQPCCIFLGRTLGKSHSDFGYVLFVFSFDFSWISLRSHLIYIKVELNCAHVFFSTFFAKPNASEYVWNFGMWDKNENLIPFMIYYGKNGNSQLGL